MAQYDIIFYKNDPESGVSLSEFWLSKPAGSNYALSQNPNTGLLYWQLFEPAFAKNNAFNKSFGSVADTVCQGNDSRLSDARTPLAHVHSFDSITSKPTTLAGYGITDGSSLALGALASNAFRGDYGTIAYNHSQIAHAPSNANYYVHPASHSPSVITQDAGNRFVSDTEKATWNAKASTAVATSSANGLMASADKTKLDGIASGANNYTHPANHAAGVITQDANNRFVSDTEKAAWNAKASTALATTSVNGLMACTDKTKLDGIAAGANNYTHPANHAASVVTQDANNRFVTDAEKAGWNAKGTSNLALGTTSATAFRGDYGNAAYSHSLAAHAPSNAQANADISKAEIEAKLTGAISSHSHDYVANSRLSYGTADPSGGNDGDVYFQYE